MLLAHREAFETLSAVERESEQLTTTRFAPHVLAAVQADKLKATWARAATTEYYGRRLGRRPPDLTTLEVTPKAAVRLHPEHFLTRLGRTPIKYYETSGTTGLPIATPRLAEDIVWNTVSVARVWQRIVNAEQRVAMLLPSDVSPIGDLIAGVCEYLGACLLRCYPFAVGICDWARIEQLFARYEPTCLFAAPGVLVQFMRVLKQHRTFETTKKSLRTIALLGEVSGTSLRSMLATNWGCDIYDASYGSTETGTIAATCEAQRLHLLSYGFIVEVASEAGCERSPAASRGEMVVTPLNLYARALLRYATGDLVEVEAAGGCRCGLLLPTVRIAGRKEERVELASRPVPMDQLEDSVYRLPGITGYVVELNERTGERRLLLEKDIDAEMNQGPAPTWRDALASEGLEFDRVLVLAQLPVLTKSGGSQKNWKRTNVRVVS